MNFEFPAVFDAAVGDQRILCTAGQMLARIVGRRNEGEGARSVVRSRVHSHAALPPIDDGWRPRPGGAAFEGDGFSSRQRLLFAFDPHGQRADCNGMGGDMVSSACSYRRQQKATVFRSLDRRMHASTPRRCSVHVYSTLVYIKMDDSVHGCSELIYHAQTYIQNRKKNTS